MLSRCYNENTPSYKKYGARGIKVCDEWRHSFEAFKDWAFASGFSESLERSECSLDRIDVNGDYSPENCRWADAFVQANNRRNTIYIKYKGETKSLSALVKEFGVKYHTLYARLYKLNMSVEEAFNT